MQNQSKGQIMNKITFESDEFWASYDLTMSR